ncbi:uncharacterized protein FTJAE_1957 [Fusarium tjaetaba]|uniref:Uncharacterized protein n=1 Tax=Fusarium tjaetaba TaxID=1567544 RepID=A0A8H5W2K1_9HYPO|nr:uncharacterized protein FTJAE_1957 [Fusarium tjaetaba]KAF5646667.1 hypothetical protein FTJAE_1957 [Fusarium tjaetaba]
MPLPKTDEEIKASWSHQEWEFYAWEEKNKEKILDTLSRDAAWDAHSKFMKQAWPDPEGRREYFEWAHAWNGRMFVRNKYAMNTEDYIEMISQANYLDTDKVERVSRAICAYPKDFVAIGETTFGRVFSGYAFTPITDFLEPKYPDSDSDVLGSMILALSIHVPHSPPLSPGSSVHPFNTDSEKGGHLIAAIPSAVEKTHAHVSATCESGPQDFVFVQLGLLWTFTGDWEKVRDGNPNDDKRGEWNPTGFAVVARLGPNGKPGAIYVIHHPDPEPKLKKFGDELDEDSDEDLDEDFDGGLVEHQKSHKNEQKTSKQGIFLEHYIPRHPHPKSNSSFWIAKIANSIQDMGSYKRKFEFDVISSEEPQIVNAKIWTCGLDGPPLTPVREPDEIDI